ncbi:MAG TPA: DUF2752 domain-containing protein [Baekduia sp.]|nr:DUF2752 domain-containing protein [Baekduia sp.]
MERSAAIDAGNPRGAALAIAAAAPFAIGRLAGGLVTGDGALTPHVLCPLRAMTGIPCPLCGATRSVVLATHGDTAFLTLNPVWVVVLAALALAGAALVLAQAAGVTIPRGHIPARAWWTLGVLVAAAGWACALLHRQAIGGA